MSLSEKIAAEGAADRELAAALLSYATQRDRRATEHVIIDPMPVLDAEHARGVSTIRTGPWFDAPLGSGLAELHTAGHLHDLAADVREQGALAAYTNWFSAGGIMDTLRPPAVESESSNPE